MSMSKIIKCPKCLGKKELPVLPWMTMGKCPTCRGRGAFRVPDRPAPAPPKPTVQLDLFVEPSR